MCITIVHMSASFGDMEACVCSNLCIIIGMFSVAARNAHYTPTSTGTTTGV